jgi:outer membrane usher protein
MNKRHCVIGLCASIVMWLYPAASMGSDSASHIQATPVIDSNLSPSNKTREELFLEIFKRPALDIPLSSYVFFVVNEGAPQKVKAVLSQGEANILLEGKPVIAILSEQLLWSNILQGLKGRIDAQGWLNRIALEEAGISTSFNSHKFEFSVTTEASMRQRQVKYLTPPMVDPFSVNAIRPAPVSAFVNFDIKSLVTQTETSASATNQTHTGFSAKGAMNVNGIVVEGSAIGQIGGSNSLERGDIRLVYDQPQRALRYTLGDLRYPVIGYQKAVNMGGFGIARDFSLQPHVRTYRVGHFEFYLQHPASVKVWVNESLVSTLQLPSGTHDIRGFTPAVGQNDTRLLIEDSAGRREVLNFSYIFNPVLLAKGRNLFSYNAGFPRELKGGLYEYDLKNPVLSASYLVGLTDETTLGIYSQAGDSQTLLGVKTMHVLPVGTIQLDIATSRSGFSRQDMATKIDWARTPSRSRGLGVQSQLSVEYLGKSFGSANDSSLTQRNVLNFNGALSFPMGNGISAQLTGSYTPARTVSSMDAHRVATTLTQRWGKYTMVSASLRRYRSNQKEMISEVLFGINFNFSNGISNFYVTKEMESNTIASRWDSGRPSNTTGAYQFASTRFGSGQREYLGGAGYLGHQGLVEVSHSQADIIQDTGNISRKETAVRLQSALVLANTTIALARPVSENFAIVKGKTGLDGVVMMVDPDGRGGSRAQTSMMGPAVVVDIANYRLRELRVEPVDPPLGATPEKMTFSLAAKYKSGFLLELGRERRIFAIGRLVDQQGPIANLPIKIRHLDDLGANSLSTLTSRNGGFQMPDIKPGRYEISYSSTTRWGSVIVDIPDTKNDIYRLGNVVVLP